MPRSRAPWLLVPFALVGCGREIVLGDSENRLPNAPSAAGSSSLPSTGGGAGSGPTGGMPSVAGTASVAGTGAAAGTPPDVVPEPGALLWSAEHEQGDLREWEEGGDYYGGEYEWASGSYSVEPDSGRDGSHGLIATIDTHANDEPSQGVRVYRRIEDAPAYYSVWLKLAERHSVTEWWSIFLFHARDDTLSLENDVSLWDVRVVEDRDGVMTLQFFDHDTMQGTIDEKAGRIQEGEWFELSAYLDYRPPDDTRLRILHNGALLFDMKARHTSREDNVFWALGNGSDELDPSESTIYLDDAAIRRAGAP